MDFGDETNLSSSTEVMDAGRYAPLIRVIARKHRDENGFFLEEDQDSTVLLKNTMADIEKKFKIFSEIINNQQRIIDYKDLYISYLSGLISETEFEKESDEYIKEKNYNFSKDDIIYVIRTITPSLTWRAPTCSDIADMINVEDSLVEESVKTICGEGNFLGK